MNVRKVRAAVQSEFENCDLLVQEMQGTLHDGIPFQLHKTYPVCHRHITVYEFPVKVKTITHVDVKGVNL